MAQKKIANDAEMRNDWLISEIFPARATNTAHKHNIAADILKAVAPNRRAATFLPILCLTAM
jgi:hypothetical protein